MFRFTQWMPAGHNWTSWLKWFRSQNIIAEVVRCNDPGYQHHVDDEHPLGRCRYGHTAVFREGEESVVDRVMDRRKESRYEP